MQTVVTIAATDLSATCGLEGHNNWFPPALRNIRSMLEISAVSEQASSVIDICTKLLICMTSRPRASWDDDSVMPGAGLLDHGVAVRIGCGRFQPTTRRRKKFGILRLREADRSLQMRAEPHRGAGPYKQSELV